MKSGYTVVLALGFAALSGAPLAAQPPGRPVGDQDAGKYGWLSSLEEGKAQAKMSGRPLMVVLRCRP